MTDRTSNERMPYLLSTYRIDDRVVIQCENVEKAEEALSRVMAWLHSQVETPREPNSDVLAIRLRNAKEFMARLPNGPSLHHLTDLVASIEHLLRDVADSPRPFLQCRHCKRTTTREDRGDTYGSYCGVKLADGGPCPGVMALYPADGSAVKTGTRHSDGEPV